MATLPVEDVIATSAAVSPKSMLNPVPKGDVFVVENLVCVDGYDHCGNDPRPGAAGKVGWRIGRCLLRVDDVLNADGFDG